MSPYKTAQDVVGIYMEGFRRSDHELILSCLTDDAVWLLHGCTTLTGKDAFDREIENDATVGSWQPEAQYRSADRRGRHRGGHGPRGGPPAKRCPPQVCFQRRLTFTADKISGLETYQVNLS
jgi:uncharacterized protein